MKIRSFPADSELVDTRRQELLDLVGRSSDRDQRPCSGCNLPCACERRSLNCCCQCSAACPEAPRALSSEPSSHPIEAGVLPLVYALATLRVTPPCWSCEGHLLPGAPPRLPQVWFQSASALAAELLQAHVSDLHHARALSFDWEVAVCEHQTDRYVTTFVLRPNAPAELHLGRMRADVAHIAQDLAARVRFLAHARLRALGAER